MTETKTPAVYGLIAKVSGELAKAGIVKGRNNAQQGYAFRGIDDVYNALAPFLAKHELVILPRITSRSVVERQTRSGSALFYVTVEAEFDFVAAVDGSRHTVRIYGEAMDSGDKATNKAMSAAYKYAAFQTFCIPTEGDNDADATTHDVAGKTQAPDVPEGFDDWWSDMVSAADNGIKALQEAWGKSPVDYRTYVNTAKRREWEAIKDKAKKATPEAA